MYACILPFSKLIIGKSQIFSTLVRVFAPLYVVLTGLIAHLDRLCIYHWLSVLIILLVVGTLYMRQFFLQTTADG